VAQKRDREKTGQHAGALVSYEKLSKKDLIPTSPTPPKINDDTIFGINK